MSLKPIHIIGAGLAGSEAAYFLAQRNHKVVIHEMRPLQMTPAHKTGQCAELVCSNSFKSKSPQSAPGLLKKEMKELGSLNIEMAETASVPGGEALAVDRDLFSDLITEKLKNHPNITFLPEEVTHAIPDAITLIATGPLTSEKLSHWLLTFTGEEDLYFYDAIAPILDASSLDQEKIFLANRYDKGEEKAYLNCPMNKEEYNNFIDALLTAEQVTPKNFEKEKFFQGCQPIEAIASSGRESLRFGPMKPVGLVDPKTNKEPYAAVQLRPENLSCTAYNMVGFQTKLKYPEQKRIFQMIPGLENCEFLRLGSIHRNTYLKGPKVLQPDLSLKKKPFVYLAGQITGVEGYLESSACGLLAALFIHQRASGLPHQAPPINTALGALLNHIVASQQKNYQPSNIHFGLFEHHYFENLIGIKKEFIRGAITEQAFQNLKNWKEQLNLGL